MKKIIALMLIFPLLFAFTGCNTKNTEETNPVTDRDSLKQALAGADPWESLPLGEQYTILSMEGSESRYEGTGAVLPEGAQDKSVEIVTVSGKSKLTGTLHELTVSAYEIAGINPECAVSAELGDGNLYIFRNPDYVPHTLGQMLEDTSLSTTAEFGYVYAHDAVRYDPVPLEIVWNLLEDEDASIYMTRHVPSVAEGFWIAVDLPVLGCENAMFYISDAENEGQIAINLFGEFWFYDIDATRVQAFIDYMHLQSGVELATIDTVELTE